MLEEFNNGILSAMGADRDSSEGGYEELEEFLEMKPGANPAFEYTCNLCQLSAVTKSGKFYHKVRRTSNRYYPCDMCKFVEQTLETLTKQKSSVVVKKSNKDQQSASSNLPSKQQNDDLIQGVSISSVMGNYRVPEGRIGPAAKKVKLAEKVKEITPMSIRPGDSLLLKPVNHPLTPDLSMYHCTDCTFVATSVKILVNHMHRQHSSQDKRENVAQRREKKDKAKSYPINLVPLKEAQHVTMEKDPLEAIGESDQTTSESGGDSNHMKEYGINIDGEDMVALLNCPECSYTTPEPAELRIHVEQEHPGERFACELCNFFATRKSTLKTHYASIHEGIRFPCDLCKYAATQKSALRRHMKTVHNPHKLYKYQRNYAGYEKYQEKTVLIDKVPENNVLQSGLLSSPAVQIKGSESGSASPPRADATGVIQIVWNR